MEKYDLDYLKKNIDMKVLREAIDKVKGDDIESFKIGDIPMEVMESFDEGYYSLFVNLLDAYVPSVKVTKESDADEICDKIYEVNNITLDGRYREYEGTVYAFFKNINEAYGYDVKIPIGEAVYIKFIKDESVIVYVDGLVLQSRSECLDEEYEETTLYDIFIKKLNLWDMISMTVELDNKSR